MRLSLKLPLRFKQKLEAFNIIAGISSSIILPDVVISKEQELEDVFFEANDLQLEDYITYDIADNTIQYTAMTDDDSQIEQFAGENLFTIILIDSEGDEYLYDF